MYEKCLCTYVTPFLFLLLILLWKWIFLLLKYFFVYMDVFFNPSKISVLKVYTNADLKISLFACVNIKIIPWKLCVHNLMNFRVICPWSFINVLKSRLIFNIFYCFWMFVNILSRISRAHISKTKRCFNVKSSTYYFHMKTKILVDFQICLSVPLIKHFFGFILSKTYEKFS